MTWSILRENSVALESLLMPEEIKQKALKITEALYRVSDLLFDGEPLKWSLRKTALEILESASGTTVDSQYEKVKAFDRLNSLIESLFMKLELASGGTLISAMNFQVLRREYANLRNYITEQRKSLDSPILLDNLLSDIMSDKYDRKELVSIKPAGTGSENIVMSEHHSDFETRRSPLGLSAKNLNGTSEITGRRSTLLSAIKEKGATSVGELAKALSEAGIPVSEKTVQRELGALVMSGDIKQEGEKRWRRYFL